MSAESGLVVLKIWPTREVEGGGDGSKVTLLAVTSCYKHDP